ncbi:hypothetical protein H0H92_011119 [Tricholoma furcatifolium]|nr:hypothetical protein H0H92_011119 [Tricholoma furcatifolium]
MSPNSPHTIAAEWLRTFAGALEAADVAGVVSSFLPSGWLRDVLTFTWNNRSLAGRENIAAYLRSTLEMAKIANVTLDESPYLCPQQSSFNPEWIASGFHFVTAIAIGKGYFHLAQDVDGAWKAQLVLMTMNDLKGHEETTIPEQGVYSGHRLAWIDIQQERRRKIEQDPHVVIIGAGQTGLHIAARFRQMNIPTLVIEKNSRVGDNWRQRYPTLSLHTPRSHHTFLYQPYPENWPIFTPRDRLADWLEHYAICQDLVIWTDSSPLATPIYDFGAKQWTIVINKNGTHVTLNPAHVILATGTLGNARFPAVANKDLFKGITLHASEYSGGRPFSGKRVIVIGAGNTSADICQDLVTHGAESVTMVQRSSTCVVSPKSVELTVTRSWQEGVPSEVSDFIFASCSLLFLRSMVGQFEQEAWNRDRDLHEGLVKAGLKLNMGIEGAGLASLVFERGGGIDVGCAELITAGKVHVKQGVEPELFTKDSLVFSDGSELPVDVVIFATGYHNIRETVKEIFGEDTIARTSQVWGLDAEGELRGCYRPSGHPGLWYGAGDFAISRFMSKQLTSDPSSMYTSRIKGRQMLLENPARESRTKKELDEKRARQKAHKDKKKRQMIGKREAKERGVWRFDKNQAKFELFVPLHNLWMGYMSELLGLQQRPPASAPSSTHMPSSAGMHPKLVKADFHGSIVTVRRSKNPSLVNLSGIVIHETENAFKIITKKDSVKRETFKPKKDALIKLCLVIPKENSIFSFAVPLYSTLPPSYKQNEPLPAPDPAIPKTTVLELPHIEFELHGNQFRFRSAERAGRKFKHKETIEL